MRTSAVLAGSVGFGLGSVGVVSLLEPLASRVPSSRHARFLAAMWAHAASYLVGIVGGAITINGVWRSRARQTENGA